MFKRKVYNKLLEWKNKYSEKYAVMLEGARRVGKSTIAEEFAKCERCPCFWFFKRRGNGFICRDLLSCKINCNMGRRQ